MSDRPPDVDGECNAWAQIADDFGDNDCTFRCNLPADHDGWHEEAFGPLDDPKRFSWEKDKRPKLEAEDAHYRGDCDARSEDPVPQEPDEHYLEAFCLGVEESDEYERLKAECAEDIAHALLLACKRAECDDECPAKRGCDHQCRVCGEATERRCGYCRRWVCWDHEIPHESMCPSGTVARLKPVSPMKERNPEQKA